MVLIGTEKVGAPESVAARLTVRFIFDIHEARDNVQHGDLHGPYTLWVLIAHLLVLLLVCGCCCFPSITTCTSFHY